jgi:uncharacterized protein
VPFISRYRKAATGGLDDTQLRLLEDRLRYLRELEERREVIDRIDHRDSPDIMRDRHVYGSDPQVGLLGLKI